MAEITVLKANVPAGPFNREEIAAQLQRGEIRLEDLAFVEGLTQWTPLRDVLARVDGAAPPAYTPAPVTPSIDVPAADAMHPRHYLIFAGFWLRAVALLVDGIIVQVPVMIISMILGFLYGMVYGMSHPGEPVGFTSSDGTYNVSFVLLEVGIMIFSFVAQWLYFALQESSRAQATVGKRILGLRVTGLEGQRIGFARASGRYFGKILSGMIFLIGYFMAGFTQHKQALHDLLAGTYVIKGTHPFSSGIAVPVRS